MSSDRLTLAGLFGVDADGTSGERVPDLTTSEAFGRLEAELPGQAAAVWPLVRDNIGRHLATLLDIDVADVLVGGWNKSRELRKYRDEKAYPPDERVVVALAKHKLVSTHRPHLDLVVAERPIGSLHFEIELTLNIEGAQLTIQGGRIMRIATGACAGVGTIRCEGAVIGQKEKKLGALPGELNLGRGIAIPA
jgi:hypothetical protein